MLSTNGRECPECSADIPADIYEYLKTQFSIFTQKEHLKPQAVAPPASLFRLLARNLPIVVTVSLIGGDRLQFSTNTSTTVHDFRVALENHFHIPVGSQRLVLGGDELKVLLLDAVLV